ncbi:hypothetical protein HRbin30_00285 [bacterium HR30]|nr:hypothetical protein HRbin30_00285 [bacterium HR30]
MESDSTLQPPFTSASRLVTKRRYRFVDCAAAAAPGFRNHIYPVERVEEFVARFGPDDCFATIFFFSEEVFLYLAEHRVNGRPSIAGFDGRIWAPFLPFDIDAEPTAAGLLAALALARQTYAFLQQRWHVPDSAIYAYFSGHKGFHILLDTRIFGRVAPATDLHRIFSLLRLQVWRSLGVSEGLARFDQAIGDKVRLLRLTNSRHRQSGLYKIPLSAQELFSFSPDEIRALARSPRPDPRTLCQGLLPLEHVEANDTARAAFSRARRAARRGRPHPYRLPQPPQDLTAALCAARQHMLESDIPPGIRNNVAIRLASALRRAGYPQAQTNDILVAWNRKLTAPLPERELRSVVRSAYARAFPYGYGCHDEVIRLFCPFRDRLLDCPVYRQQHPERAAD